MKPTKAFLAAVLGAGVSLFGTSRAFAQDAPEPPPPQDQSQPASQAPPKPAGRQYPPVADDDATADVQSQNVTPDNLPLTGVLIPTSGSQEMRHSYWVPGLQYGNFVRSSGLENPAVTDWNSTSFVAGNLSLLQQWSRSQLSVNYTGGGDFSTDQAQGNSYFHQLAMVQSFDWRRVQLAIIESFSYLPQTQFGFGAASPLGAPGIGGPLQPSLPALQTSYQPSQSIFVGLGSRYSNSITTQLVYHLTPRGSITLSASYGILRFVEAGNISTNDTIFSAGYEYAFSSKDTIGVLYRVTGYRYIGQPQAINDNVAQVAYGRKLTGRLALQVFAGPEIATFRQALSGASFKTSVSGGANLSYKLSRTTFGINYNHGVSGGSGVFTGSELDQVGGAITRRLSRVWSGNATFGYARNVDVKGSNGAPLSPSYNSLFVGGGLNRPLGRTADLSIAYTAYIQDSSVPGCPVGGCTSYLQHQISVSFQWHTRPLILR